MKTQNHNFFIYRSSAGSGKTHALVSAYLKLALSKPQSNYYTHILAITFTNKAASEMKSRVLSTLKALVENQLEGTTEVMQRELMKELQLDQKSLNNRARRVLNHMLHHYGDIAISTIDSFVYRIIQSFSIDLGLPLQFNLSVDEDELISDTIQELIKQIGIDEKLTQDLIDFSISQIQDDNSWKFDRSLVSAAKRLLNDSEAIDEKIEYLSEENIQGLSKLLNQRINAFETEVNGLLRPCMEYLSTNNIDPLMLAGGRNGIGPSLQKTYKGSIADASKVVSKFHKIKNWSAGKAPVDIKALIEEGVPLFTEQILLLEKLLDENLSVYALHLNLKKNLFELQIFARVKAEIDAYKAVNSVVHISDFQKIIERIVSKEPVPFIYERVGEKFHHFLLDEFQDTSAIQFRNLLPLVHNSLASSQYNMVVGDGKQSIYRWRGAEVEQFSRLPKVDIPQDSLLSQAAEFIEATSKEVPLKNNWRSAENIVEFNNFIFGAIKNQLPKDFQYIYDEHAQQGQKKFKGYVNIQVPEVADKEEYDAHNLSQTTRAIQLALKDGFEHRDLCVLVRKRAESNKIVQRLLEEQIPVVSSESLLINSSQKVKLLIAIMNWLNNTEDALHQAQVAVLLAENEICSHDLHPVLKSIGTDKAFDFEHWLKQQLPEFSSELRYWSILPLCVELLRITGMDKKWDSFLEAFIDTINTRVSKENQGLVEFLEWWKQQKENLSISGSDDQNAVQVMTIHKSKGLEFPVVIMPFVAKTMRNDAKEFWFPLKQEEYHIPAGLIKLESSSSLPNTLWEAEYEEEKGKTILDEINVLYVGFTRPTHRLYAFGAFYERKKAIAEILLPLLQNHTSWNETEQALTLGEPEKHIASHKEETVSKINSFSTSNWNDKLQVSQLAPKFWDTDSLTSPAHFGNTIHRILAECVNLNEWKNILVEYQLNGLVNDEDGKDLESIFIELEKNKDLNTLFQLKGKVLKEREIILPSGEIIRPDRVVLGKEKNYVIDFKSGQKRNGHIKQVNTYRKALIAMDNKPSTGIIAYLNPVDLVYIEA